MVGQGLGKLNVFAEEDEPAKVEETVQKVENNIVFVFGKNYVRAKDQNLKLWAGGARTRPQGNIFLQQQELFAQDGWAKLHQRPTAQHEKSTKTEGNPATTDGLPTQLVQTAPST